MEKAVLTPEEIRGLLSWMPEESKTLPEIRSRRVRKKRIAVPRGKTVDFFRDVLNALGEAIIITDWTGRIVFQNECSTALLGRSPGAIRNKPFEKAVRLLDRSGNQPVVGPVQRCLTDASLFTLPSGTFLLRPDGSSISIRGSASPIIRRKGMMVGVVVNFHISRPEGSAAAASKASLVLEGAGVSTGSASDSSVPSS